MVLICHSPLENSLYSFSAIKYLPCFYRTGPLAGEKLPVRTCETDLLFYYYFFQELFGVFDVNHAFALKAVSDLF